ncbi:MAG: c-type cytochrome [Pirellulaceae bacterium]
MPGRLTQSRHLPVHERQSKQLFARKLLPSIVCHFPCQPILIEAVRCLRNLAACHRVQGVGHELGPSLMAIKSRGAETLLASILDPNSEVNPQYVNYLVVTLEGRVISGMIVDEGATSITLKKDEGVTETVLRVDIDQIKNTGLSLMPQGLEETLDKQAIADLIAYLMVSSFSCHSGHA